jgi:hypothetical protein
MSKRYYKDLIEYTPNIIEVWMRDSKREHNEFAVCCDNERHADALAKELNRRGYEITEFHACMIANELKVK